MIAMNRGGGSSFTLVRQILQAWTYMCMWKAGLPTVFRESDVQVPIVQSTISLRSMLMLGGSGGMPPQEIFEK